MADNDKVASAAGLRAVVSTVHLWVGWRMRGSTKDEGHGDAETGSQESLSRVLRIVRAAPRITIQMYGNSPGRDRQGSPGLFFILLISMD
jgi:hypothetical protein